MTRVLPVKPPRPVAIEVLEGLAAMPTSIVSDVSGGRLLLDPQIRPLRPLEERRHFGNAVTAWCEPADIGAAIHAIEIAGPGDIVVIDAGGNCQTAVVGEHVCGAARRRGISCVIIDGAARDIASIIAWPDFTLFVRGRTARGPVSIARGTVNEPITCGNVAVKPGDLIVADDDGVIAVPREDAEHWFARSVEKLTLEQGWDRRLSAGESMLDVFGLRGE